MPKVNSSGRVFYVEPNATDDNTINNKIPYEYEDYVMDVDLEVVLSDRYSCGNGFKGLKDDSIKMSTSLRPIKNSVYGNKEFLTTDYSEVTMYNTESNTTECLGLESLHITYESWMVPQVTAKFIDVRGASLMSPMEDAYNRTLRENGDTRKLTGGSFFKALFTFPYPMFILKVKGFYGRRVCYNLVVEDVKSDFNADTGNFEINVKFVGYIYRALADIPMSYLAIAPYLTYNGTNYWNASNFTYDNEQNQSGAPIKTFPELRKQIAEASTQLNTTRGDSPEATTIKTTNEQKSKLEEILTAFNSLSNDIFKNAYVKIPITSEKETKYYGLMKNIVNSTTGVDVISEYTGYTALMSLVGKFNTEFTDKQIKSGFELIYYNIDLNVDGGKTLTWDLILEQIGIKTQGDINIKSTPENIKQYCLFRTNNFEREINKLIEDCTNEQTNAEETINDSTNEQLGILLDFYPSIGNAYKTVHAHADTFMAAFYQCLHNIQNNPSGRALKDLNVNVKDTDLEPKFGNDKPLPPFPAIFKTKNGVKELTWPGDISGGQKFEEVNFVNALLNAGSIARSEVDEALVAEQVSLTDSGNTESGNGNINTSAADSDVSNGFCPLTAMDFFNGNPYRFLQNYTDKDIAQYVYLTLMLRYLYYRGTYYNSTISSIDEYAPTAFGELDALNFYQIKDKYSSVLDNLINENNIDSLIEGFLSSDTDKEYIHIADAPFNHAVIGKKDDIHYSYTWGNGKVDGVDIHYIPIKYEKRYKTPKTGNNYIIYDNSDEDIRKGLTGDTFVYREGKLEDIANNLEQQKVDNCNEIIKNILGTRNDKKVEKTRENSYNVLGETRVGFDPNKYMKYRLYGTDLFYAQNDITDLDKRLLAKAFLFINSYGPEYRDKLGDGWSTRYDNILRIGSLIWRIENKNASGEWEEVIKVPSKYKACDRNCIYTVDDAKNKVNKRDFYILKTTDKTKYSNGFASEYNNYSLSKKKELKEAFLQWARDEKGFKGLNAGLELQRKGDNTLFNSGTWEEYINVGKFTIDSLGYCPYKKINMLENDSNCLKIYDIDWAKVDGDNGGINQKLIGTENQGLDAYYIAIDYRDCNGKHGAIQTEIKGCFTSFCRKLSDIYNKIKTDTNTDTVITTISSKATKSQQIATYYTLKNLYDKWLASTDESEWKLGSSNSIYNTFRYIDSYYKNVKNSIMVNIKDFSELGSRVTPCVNVVTNSDTGEKTETTYEGMSMYEFLASVAEKTKGMLLAYPVGSTLNIDNDGTSDTLHDMFTPILPWDGTKKDETSSFIFLYGGIPSAHLSPYDDNTDNTTVLSQYANDGFNVANANGEVTTTNPDIEALVSTSDSDDYALPVFGVSYARQNQSIFKKVSVGMSNAQVTEASIAATLHVASQGAEGPREFTLYGQDLYSIYSNYSYSCDVEMMGDAQIMPMLCFQLNNIPMFKGVYQIIKVEHDIVAGNMTTKFTGVRVNKYAVPKVDDSLQAASWTSSDFTRTNVTRSGLYKSASSLVTDNDRAQGIARVAETQLNRVGKGKTYEQFGLQSDYWNDIGYPGLANAAWCATFVTWCCLQCESFGYPVFPKNQRPSSCLAWEYFGLNNNCIHYANDGNYLPQRNDIVLFDQDCTAKKCNNENCNHPCHAAVVAEVVQGSTTTSGTIKTIDGNSGDSVKGPTAKTYGKNFPKVSKGSKQWVYAFIHIEPYKSYYTKNVWDVTDKSLLKKTRHHKDGKCNK